MPVDTKRVEGRRTLRFNSVDEIMADAEKLVSSPYTKVLGNWPLERLLSHLTRAMNNSIDGINAKAPFFIRWIGGLLKGRILTKGMSPGRKLPKEIDAKFFPEVASPQEALEKMRLAVGRIHKEKMNAVHPVFGKLTHEEWLQLHLRHAELHLSFALPGA